MPPSTLFAVGIAESSGATGIVTEAMMANRRLKLTGAAFSVLSIAVRN